MREKEIDMDAPEEHPEEPLLVKYINKPEKKESTPYDTTENYQYENLNPTEEELAEDFD